METTSELSVSEFAKDVKSGLRKSPKTLPSKYFYDKTGDRIFQDIMKMPEYYPTGCEFEIFTQQKEKLLSFFWEGKKPFQLIEFGAGDGTKTKILLKYFLDQLADFSYLPIDISGNVLSILKDTLKQELPGLNVRPIQNDYFEALKELQKDHTHRKVILFLGGNIGNFMVKSATDFLHHIQEFLHPGDLVLVGVDLKKNPKLILSAYDDPQGITSAFNLNLLARMNRELGADFQLNQFKHYATYHPVSGDMRSYLISQKEQTVSIEALNETFHFNQWEPVYTELSKKYAISEIEKLAADSGFEVVEHLFDCKHYFTDTLWTPKS